MIVDTISILQYIGRVYDSLAFISMNDSYNRNYGGNVRLDFCHDFSITTQVVLLCIRIALLMALANHGNYIYSMFSIFCNMTD